MDIDPEFDVFAECDDLPLEGAFASGDDDLDAVTITEIRHRLADGDVWAWAYVVVRATLVVDGETFTGSSSLSGCNYADEADFRQPGGYFDDMKAEAVDDLRLSLAAAVRRGGIAKNVVV